MRHIILSLPVVLASLVVASGCPAPDPGNPDGGVPRQQPTTLSINEVMASNAATLADKDGGFDDWIEIYNLTGADIALDGFALADGPDSAASFIAGAVVPAGGFLVVFADDDVDGGTAAQPHFPFKLSAANGETITLTDADGDVVDALEVPPLSADQSFGSATDGGVDADILAAATPGASNG